MARKAPTFESLAAEYATLFDAAKTAPAHAAEVDRLASAIAGNRQRYEDTVQGLSVPWWLVGLIHAMECTEFPRFSQHLHNGDSLRRRTVQVPAGRPVRGEPPFTFGESARDALEYDGLTKIAAEDWTLERALYCLESFNGWGSRWRGVHTPYLWSYTQHYAGGKFVADHVWDKNAVSDQAGAAAVLARLMEITELEIPRHGAAPPAPIGGGKFKPTQSRTVLGTLYVVLGAVVGFINWLGAFAVEVVTAAKQIKDPAEQVLSEIGANIPALSFVAIGLGVILVLYARGTDAASNPKPG